MSAIGEKAFWRTKISSQNLLDAVCELDPLSQIVIYLRFWELSTIDEIANLLSLKWEVANEVLEESFRVLRCRLGAFPDQQFKAAASAS